MLELPERMHNFTLVNGVYRHNTSGRIMFTTRITMLERQMGLPEGHGTARSRETWNDPDKLRDFLTFMKAIGQDGMKVAVKESGKSLSVLTYMLWRNVNLDIRARA